MNLSNFRIRHKGIAVAICATALSATGVVTTAALADNDAGSTHNRINALFTKVHEASTKAISEGHTVNTDKGVMFSSEISSQMADLERAARAQADALIARPASQRAEAITAIKSFANNQDLDVQYQRTVKSSYNPAALTEVYYAGLDEYDVNISNNTIIQYGPRPNRPGEDPKKFNLEDRFTSEQLKQMAIDFISTQASSDIGNLSYTEKTKNGTNYFFRWEGKGRLFNSLPTFIQVGYTTNGDMLSYTNTLEL